ncbi:MAG: family 10 glycosylhydrolase [Cyclonatronaceae bacterium]
MNRIIPVLIMTGLVMAGSSLRTAAAENPEIPKHEFRSVWVATVVNDWTGIGWPPPIDMMNNILDRAERLGLNAVVLQVVGRGDAIYPSERLPWSHVMIPPSGEYPDWDPLQTWIDATHERGMEFHAWFNVNMVAYGTERDSDREDQLHVRYSNPEWMAYNIENGDSVMTNWLNPGHPEARAWQVGNVMELVENYDVDAIHFDYIRYDNGGFNTDPATMDLYNEDNIGNLADWRRHNVNTFVKEVYEGVQERKPWVKIGAAPVGHYDRQSADGWAGFWGYNAAYQDSRHWAEHGHLDYIAPQVYWTIGTSPRFEYIVSDWVQNRRNDRHLYIGTNPSNSDIRNQIGRQIDTTRTRGAEGQIHFRYRSISQSWSVFSGRYDTKAIIPSMPWRSMNKPDAVLDLAVYPGNFEIHLDWEQPESRDENTRFRYAIYRVHSSDQRPASEIIENASSLIALTGLTSYLDVFDTENEGDEYRYIVTALSRNNVEGDLSEQQAMVVSADGEPLLASEFELRQNYPNPFNPETTISFRLPEASHARLTVYDVLGREVAVLVDETLPSGTHSVVFEAGSLATGIYIYRLQAGDFTQSRKMLFSK